MWGQRLLDQSLARVAGAKDVMARIPESEARRIAVAAGADPRSVHKLTRGERVSPLVAERILAALVALKLDHLIPSRERKASRS